MLEESLHLVGRERAFRSGSEENPAPLPAGLGLEKALAVLLRFEERHTPQHLLKSRSEETPIRA
jgi:hypothetical protein